MKRIPPEIIRLLFPAVLILAAANSPLEAQNFFGSLSWAAAGSVFLFPEDNGMRSDPMPVLPSPGMAVSYPVADPFGIEFTLDLYFTHYGYDFVLDRAVPYAIENRSSFVWGSVLGLHALWNLPLNQTANLRLYAGPAFDLRLVLIAEDLDNETAAEMADIRGQTDSVRDYFWSQGRWFLPVAGGGMDFKLNSALKLGFDLRVWFPVYKFWSGEDLPPVEGWRFGVGARLTFLRAPRN